jgi:biopolymer transport protein ExbD
MVGADSADDARGTVAISPQLDDGSKTVMLEAIEVTEVVPEPREPTPPPVAPPPEEPAPAVAEVEDEEPEGLMKRRTLEETEMDMTPMVDVTFLLLIFFMVTAAFTMQKSLEVPKPQTDQASTQVQEEEEQDSDRVTVQVDENNTYQVITIDWEEEAPSVQELITFLRQARDGDSTGRQPTILLVEANGEALHDKVVSALDAGSRTGFQEVLLAMIEDE